MRIINLISEKKRMVKGKIKEYQRVSLQKREKKLEMLKKENKRLEYEKKMREDLGKEERKNKELRHNKLPQFLRPGESKPIGSLVSNKPLIKKEKKKKEWWE